MPDIDHHIGPGWHVARDAGRRRVDGRMLAMLHIGVFVGGMALQADAFAGDAKLRAVRLVTIAAGDTGGKHPALLERRVIVRFLDIADLAVGMICDARQRFDHMGLRQRLSGYPVFKETGAARVAEPASLNFFAQRWRPCGALGASGLWVYRPGDALMFVKPHQQSLAGILALTKRPPVPLIARPGGMARALPMTGFAADTDFRPCGGEAIFGRVVVLAQAGRVALGTHEIPVLVQLGPVQDIVMFDLFVG
ncbi:hypothetical protein BN961_01824 [Afipia felis]|uniref:Uncharacterized protein n=1 Tax=Afipia felis TaxID=1035 RepID=A0A090MS51_AFIFE|nr:hypothetical protein BN961_01824 [Afipia felis]